MSLNRVLSFALAVSLVPTVATFAADGYGSVTGQFVFEGDVPKVPFLVSKGDASAKDSAVCAAGNILNEDLVVDEKTKGIANVFVYLRKAEDIHPDLAKSKKKEVIFDQKGCQFFPHAMIVRTDQVVKVVSDDSVAHNTHSFPLRNQAINFILRPKDRVGIKIPSKRPEILPIQVKCDIHPWMKAYWLILDHPYMAVTGKTGKFTIEKLPAGEHSFRVWQEKVGYVERSLKVTIKAGETVDLGAIKVPASKFKD